MIHRKNKPWRQWLKLFAMACILPILACAVSVPVTQTAHAAVNYNADAAVNYAVNHWNDGSGMCDGFVIACLAAGGISINTLGVANVYQALLNYGTSHQVVFDDNFYANCKVSDNAGYIAPGDIIFYYCTSCGCWTHTAIITRIDEGGVPHFCSHNPARYDSYFNQTYSDEHGHIYPNIKHYVIHITGSSGAAQLSVSAGNSLSPSTFTWTGVSGASAYNCRIFKDVLYTGQDYTQWNVGSGTQVTLPAGTYYGYVDTCFSDDSVTQSNIVQFTVAQAYSVTYNANGGTGAPASQIKVNGTALTLSGSKPTRSGYTFQGWSTSAGGSVVYAAGASYTNNASVTLYAVWKELTYTLTVKTYRNGSASGVYTPFELKVNGTTVASENASYSGSFKPGSTYAVTPGAAMAGDHYDGMTGGAASGTLNGNVSLILHYSETGVQITTTTLPDGVSGDDYDIEYRSYEEQIATVSPGSDWVEDAGYSGAYVNTGSVYTSDLPLATSNTRVEVTAQSFYYHFCSGSTGMNCNWYLKGNYVHEDRISDVNSVDIAETHTDSDGTHHYYSLKWKDGSYAYCNSGGNHPTCDGAWGTHGNRSYYWYRMYAYQDRVQQKRYIRDTGWTSVMPSGGKYTQVRYTYNPKVSAIDFDTYGADIKRGETLVPGMTLLPETAERADLTWVSDDPAVATVDGDGAITAVRFGSTRITASNADGSVSDTLYVTVGPNLDASSMFVVDGVSSGYFTSVSEEEGTGVTAGPLSEYSRESLVCMVREPGDVLSCEAALSFINYRDEYIATYEVTEGNLIPAGSDAFVISKNTARKNIITAHIYDVNEDGSQGPEMATANMVVFVVNNDGTLTLPAGLRRLEANALDGAAATIIRLPDHVTLEDNSLAGLPAGTIIYFNSDTIIPFIDLYVLGTGEGRDPNYYWIDTGTPTMAYFNGDGCATNYYCMGIKK